VNAAFEILDRTDRELWVVTAQAEGRRGGLIATFVTSASIAPEMPRVLVGLARQHHTWALVERSGAFALHLLGEEHLEWVWRFGLVSGRDADKIIGLTVTAAATGSPVLTEALAWLDCRVEARLETGDRTVYLAEIVASANAKEGAPLTLRRILALAPQEKRLLLKKALQRDAQIDAQAIRSWRNPTSARRGGST